MIDNESNQPYAIYDQSLLKLKSRDNISEFDDYLIIYLEAFDEMREIFQIDDESFVVINDNDISCEVIIEKLVEIFE